MSLLGCRRCGAVFDHEHGPHAKLCADCRRTVGMAAKRALRASSRSTCSQCGQRIPAERPAFVRTCSEACEVSRLAARRAHRADLERARRARLASSPAPEGSPE